MGSEPIKEENYRTKRNTMHRQKLDFKRYEKLMPYKLPESTEIFVTAFNLCNDAVAGNKPFDECYQKLLALRHQSLVNLNNFLNDEANEKAHPMDTEDSEGWKLYNEVAEKFRILDFFFMRLHNHTMGNLMQ